MFFSCNAMVIDLAVRSDFPISRAISFWVSKGFICTMRSRATSSKVQFLHFGDNLLICENDFDFISHFFCRGYLYEIKLFAYKNSHFLANKGRRIYFFVKINHFYINSFTFMYGYFHFEIYSLFFLLSYTIIGTAE